MNRTALLIPISIALTLIIIAWRRGGAGAVGDGFVAGGRLFRDVLPNLLIGFTLAGFLTLLLPQEAVARWLGAGSGWRGILAGTAAGTVTPGGPFTHFPILAGLIVKGAAIGPVCAYIAAWAVLGIHRILIWEVPILGWRFVLVRVGASVLFPPIIGFIAQAIAAAAGVEAHPKTP